MSERYSQLASRVRVPAGFLLGAIYVAFAEPSPARLWWGSAVALAGLALRAASAGDLEKNRKLARSGPYAYTRNPLYLGSAVAGAGFCIAGGQGWFFLLLGALLAGVYWPVLRSEQAHLSRVFPEEYPSYARAVPLLLPRLRAWREPGAERERFTWSRYRRNREYEALLAYAAIIVILWGKMLWIEGS